MDKKKMEIPRVNTLSKFMNIYLTFIYGFDKMVCHNLDHNSEFPPKTFSRVLFKKVYQRLVRPKKHLLCYCTMFRVLQHEIQLFVIVVFLLKYKKKIGLAKITIKYCFCFVLTWFMYHIEGYNFSKKKKKVWNN